MIQKIKGLISMKGEIDRMKSSLENASSSIESLKNEIASLKGQINDSVSQINAKNSELLKNFNENLGLMQEIRQNFEEELYQFKLLKSQMQKKMMERFEEELNKELKMQMEALKNDSQSYSRLKDEVGSISQKISALNNEMHRLISVSSTIKKEDFQLTRFANRIFEADREKLDLMRKIDALERLVSKMRREYVAR